jgi:hypothetical protein
MSRVDLASIIPAGVLVRACLGRLSSEVTFICGGGCHGTHSDERSSVQQSDTASRRDDI